MTESEINLDDIVNLKHRAILNALFSTDLMVHEIAQKLDCTTGSIYYCVGRYLYKGYCEKRTQRLQMKHLYSIAKHEVQSAEIKARDEDLVTEVKLLSAETTEPKALPAPAESHTSTAPEETAEEKEHRSDVRTVSQSHTLPPQNIHNLTETQNKIYEFIKETIKDKPRNFYMSISKFIILYKKVYGIGFARRDFYKARSKLLAEQKAESQVQSAFRSNQVSADTLDSARLLQKKGYIDNTLKIEYQGMKLSLDFDCSDVGLNKVIGLLRNILTMHGAN